MDRRRGPRICIYRIGDNFGEEGTARGRIRDVDFAELDRGTAVIAVVCPFIIAVIFVIAILLNCVVVRLLFAFNGRKALRQSVELVIAKGSGQNGYNAM